MAIETKLITYATEAKFNSANVNPKSIVFIRDTQRIWAQGVFFDTQWGKIGGKPSTFPAATHTHPAVDIDESSVKRFITDAERITWNGKLNTSIFNAMEIGGRNLLLNSRPYISNNSYPTATFYLAETINNGEQVTISIKGVLGIGKLYFAIYNSGGSVNMTTVRPTDLKADGVFRVTFNWISGTSSNTFINVYPIVSTTDSISSIEWVKLERGNKATSDWFPAPEDIYNYIDIHKNDSTSHFLSEEKDFFINHVNTVTDHMNNGNFHFTGTEKAALADVFGWGPHAGKYLGILETAADSSKLGGVLASHFVQGTNINRVTQITGIDTDTLWKAGFYAGYNNTNSFAVGDNGFIVIPTWTNTSATSRYATLLGGAIGGNLYVKSAGINGSGVWYEMYSSRNLSATTLGLGSVTNESKATMFTNPTFTGIPRAPLPIDTSNDTQIATTAFVKNETVKYLPLAGGTITGLLTYTNIQSKIWSPSVSTDGYRSFYNLAFYGTSASTVAGSIQVKIPITTSTMWRAKIVIKNYSTASIDLTVTGYHTANHAPYVQCNNPNSISAVRFSRSSDNNTVIIIDITGLSYPKIVLEQFDVHHSDITSANFRDSSKYFITVSSDETDLTIGPTVPNISFQRDSFYLNASNISAGILPVSRLGSNTRTNVLFLRGDNTWATPLDTKYTAGNGLNLNTLSFALGTPTSITAVSTNSVASTSHTHSLDTSSGVDWITVLTGNQTGFQSGSANSPINSSTVMGFSVPLVGNVAYSAAFAIRNSKAYIRTKENNILQDWYEIWTAANFNPSNYSGSGHNHDTIYAKLAGLSTQDFSAATLTASKLISTIAQGTAPLIITSSTVVTNLNADMLDGEHASAFIKESTSGTDTFGLVTITKSLNLTTSWQDTGIPNTTLPTGTYIIQISCNDYAVGGNYSATYTGQMTWFNSGTNGSDTAEVPLYVVGHAILKRRIYVRTKERSQSTMMLEICADYNATAVSNYTFKFRRII